jgi:16S rRNA C967 or C1407 C5-methylase (RsmB/RsmF family)/NOL1/NOP2/fmu family ribosome biogenesis protein
MRSRKIDKMFPERFVERINQQHYIDADNLLNALASPSPVSIRINPGKWRMHPSGGEPVSWCRDGFYLNFRPSFTLDPLFHAGVYYPQEASGMFLEEIFDQLDLQDADLKILDLCGAPGGKSTHLSGIIGNKGILVANEVIRSRAFTLKENLTKWGSVNTIVTQNDPSDFRRLEEFFDIVLVDAPCSGEGMFRDPSAVNEWSVQNLSYCTERQKRILSDVWPALRRNGCLIYSTCTFNPEENELNVQWLADKMGAQSVRLETNSFPEIKEIRYKDIYGYGFYPGEVKGEGLFYSVLRKDEGKEYHMPIPNQAYYTKPVNEEAGMASKWSTFQSRDLIKSGYDIVAVPDINTYNQLLYKKFRVIKPGTGILAIKKGKYFPSPDLALSSGLREDVLPVLELGYEQALKYLKRDIPDVNDLPYGWFVFKYNGINLGFAKNIGHRTNNYYPVDWRIRMDLPIKGQTKIVAWTL